MFAEIPARAINEWEGPVEPTVVFNHFPSGFRDGSDGERDSRGKEKAKV